MQIAQGKVLGGSSSVNGMIYLRGQPQDYDGWAQQYGCTGWSYQDVLPYFKRAEANESLADEYHGTEGLLPVSENRYRHPLSMAFIRAGQELDLPYRNDFNGASQHGVGFYQTTTHNGERASTSRTYLQAVRDNSRLVVKLNALVHRVTFENNVATGVVYSLNGGNEIVAHASQEVILSAGAIGSPKILMLSGIGPRETSGAVGYYAAGRSAGGQKLPRSPAYVD
ncbi:Alcohol dehydrogenase [acceptor] [Serratia fonticola]|uniref:Alcohol dehydrogenase [acceptor] n=1 Tax=Serratia fonticola TaxID=47917 RepID=A0A4U9TMG6_SERFO|nr:Alcohol dehydrogenase [acceptor] [Serratia fonticola]